MAVGLLALILGTFYTVKNNHFVVVERFGKYIKTSQPGLHFKIPFIDRVSSAWNMAIFEQLVEVETITSDKVSVVLEVPVQFQVIQGREVDAVYKLGSRKERIESLVFDEVRSRVPKLSLDQLFNSKDDIAVSVREDLKTDLIQFGYDINRVMITDVEPDAKVKEKMNEVNASLKEGEAMLARATNEQRVQVANAEGRLKAATLNRDAELIDAEAVAKSVEIIGKALHDNTGYLQWKWIHMMEERDSGDTIYVPTEAGLPILEAGKRSTTKTYPDCND
jgi:regulator of protease activity HflC (stomatin/prohibitin superfamily)